MSHVSLQTLHERANKMRLAPTKSELIFMNRLKESGIHFRFQFVIPPYIADFVLGKTVIELDGSSHDGRKVYDSKRDVQMVMAGYRVIRIANEDAATYDLSYWKSNKPKKVKNKKLSPIKKKRLQRRQEQQNRFEREAEVFEMIQLPNGDFKRVLIKAA